MKDITFVNAEDLEDLEQYAAALVSSTISLKTLEGFHIAAFNKGLLDEDEAETAKTILWEIQRLLKLYKTQIENVLDRTEIDEQQIIQSLRDMMPDIKIPRKRKYKKPKDAKQELSETADVRGKKVNSKTNKTGVKLRTDRQANKPK